MFVFFVAFEDDLDICSGIILGFCVGSLVSIMSDRANIFLKRIDVPYDLHRPWLAMCQTHDLLHFMSLLHQSHCGLDERKTYYYQFGRQYHL
jgi:hypothetical protein